MKALPIFCALIFFLLTTKGFDAFSQQPVFTQVPQPENGSAYLITQDPKGYMWFGGNGVHRYDGYSYKSYFWDPLDKTSLAFDKIDAIYADRKGIIWVGTSEKGLDRLDPETGIFTHYRYSSSDLNSISSDSISVILEDRDGKIWVGTQTSGLNCLDPATGKITRYQYNPNDANSLSYNQVTALYEDHKGTIWVGTGWLWHPPPNYKSNPGGLNRFNRANNNFTRFLPDPNDPSSLIDNRVFAIFEDSKDSFWVGTSGDGLHTMNREKASFVRHLYNVADKNGLSRPPVRNAVGWPADMISFIREDSAGTIWIGTMNGGLNHYDPESKKMIYYKSLNEKSVEKNKYESFIGSYISKDGVLWIGGFNGLYRKDPFHKEIFQHDVGSIVNCLYQDVSRKLWLGTENGLIISDSPGLNKKGSVPPGSEIMGLSVKIVNSIVEDRDGTIWIGSNNGLHSYDQRSRKIKYYQINDMITAIYPDTQGSIWLGTYQSGLVLMKSQVGSFDNYRLSITDTPLLRQNYISSILDDNAGYLWIGSLEWGGLSRYNTKSKKAEQYFPQTTIQSIFKDSDGTLWIGTYKGLYYFNPAKNNFESFTNIDAGFIGNISVYHILEDNQHFLWLNTSTGLFRLRRDRSEIILFAKQDDKSTQIYAATQAGCFKSKSGELFFSNNKGNGYYAFFPDQLKINSNKPDLQISAFRIGNQIIQPGKGSPLHLPLSQTKEIRLNYKQNVFSFDFAGIHYSNPEANRHLYMLENLDNNWRNAGEEKTAYYYNVPPGDYLFRVKAASSDGLWVEKSIVVIISPPWWRTWWAFCGYGLALIAAVLVLHRIQKRRVIEAERERTREKELAQAKEVEKAYHELKSTQAQLVQREKMASLGELTAGIAHEIQNPLNFMNNFSEVNVELIDEMQQKMENGNLDDAKVISNDIKENELKINHHGKRADAIVKGMLQHSRSSNGLKEPTDINALADEYLRLAYHGLRAKDKSFNITMHTDFDESIGKINIIPQDIGRVILNLVNNAFYAVQEKYSSASISLNSPAEDLPKDGSTVWVTTKKHSGMIEISVKDNGNGIPQKVIDKIFQPFFTTKPTGEGTGLGLSLSYDIITKGHGGDLKVNTREGEYAEFVISLPV